MRSGNVEQVGVMVDVVARLQELPNSANVLRDLPDESRAIAKQVADSTRSGLSPEEAIEIARKNTYGMTEQQKEVIRINTQEVAKSLPSFLKDQVDSEFDPSSIPFFGEEPDVPPTMQADYNVAFGKFMTLTNGDAEQAKALAFGSVKKVWAVSDVGGDNKFMKFAPEAFYSVDGFDNQWIDNQFMSDMENSGIEGGVIATDFNTGRSQAPSYPILAPNDEGIMDIVRDDVTGLPLRWSPDFKQSEEYQEVASAPAKAVISAKKKREQKLDQRASYLRRKVDQTAFSGIPRGTRKEFSASQEGKIRIRTAVNNLLARDKVDTVEAKLLLEAYDAGSIDELSAMRFK